MFMAHPNPNVFEYPGRSQPARGVCAISAVLHDGAAVRDTPTPAQSKTLCAVLLTEQPSLHVRTRSLPAAGTGDAEYLAATSDALDRAFSEFSPDILLYNAGEHILSL